MARYVIKKTTNGQLAFTLEMGDHVLLTSEPYESQTECLGGINLTRAVCRSYARYKRNLSSDFKFYFVLDTVTGRVLGRSQPFETAVEMGKGIDQLRKIGLTELVEVMM